MNSTPTHKVPPLRPSEQPSPAHRANGPPRPDRPSQPVSVGKQFFLLFL